MEPHAQKLLNEALAHVELQIKNMNAKRRAGIPRQKVVTISSRCYRIATRLLSNEQWASKFNPEGRACDSPIVGWAGDVPIMLARDAAMLSQSSHTRRDAR